MFSPISFFLLRFSVYFCSSHIIFSNPLLAFLAFFLCSTFLFLLALLRVPFFPTTVTLQLVINCLEFLSSSSNLSSSGNLSSRCPGRSHNSCIHSSAIHSNMAKRMAVENKQFSLFLKAIPHLGGSSIRRRPPAAQRRTHPSKTCRRCAPKASSGLFRQAPRLRRNWEGRLACRLATTRAG